MIDEIQNLNCQRSTPFAASRSTYNASPIQLPERIGSRVSRERKNTSGTPMPQCRGMSKIVGAVESSTQNLHLFEEFLRLRSGLPAIRSADVKHAIVNASVSGDFACASVSFGLVTVAHQRHEQHEHQPRRPP